MVIVEMLKSVAVTREVAEEKREGRLQCHPWSLSVATRFRHVYHAPLRLKVTRPLAGTLSIVAIPPSLDSTQTLLLFWNAYHWPRAVLRNVQSSRLVLASSMVENEDNSQLSATRFEC